MKNQTIMIFYYFLYFNFLFFLFYLRLSFFFNKVLYLIKQVTSIKVLQDNKLEENKIIIALKILDKDIKLNLQY